jgi:hypothetical protein
MNEDRIFKMIQMELTTDQVKLENELERIMNSDIQTDKKIAKIKDILGKLVTIEASLIKFITLTSGTNNNPN